MKNALQKHTRRVVSFSPQLLLTSLFALFLVLLVLDSDVRQGLNDKPFLQAPLESTMSPIPVVSFAGEPQVSAQAAVVMDNASHVVLYGKNTSLRFSPASTTKIMTALVSLETYQPQQTLTVHADFTTGAIVGLKVGERMSFTNMLYAMLLPSGNDAAEALAQNYPGGEKAFIAKMNEKARELHLYDTYFADPTGLSDADYTTPLDLARLASYAMQNPLFAKVVGTKEKVITTVGGAKIALSNINKLLGVNGINGIKTGFTDEAGEVLVTSRQVGPADLGHTIIAVVMKSDDRFLDTQILDSTIVRSVTYQNSSTLATVAY